jgi:stalled ribosome alternative rescue factor ArfA
LNTFEAEEENKKNRRRIEISGRGSYRRYIHYGATKYYESVSSDIVPARHSRQFWGQDKVCGGKEEDQVTGNGVS